MLFITAGQAYVFLAAVYGGLIIGATYTFFAIVRRVFDGAKWVNSLCDFAFWVLASVIMLLTSLIASQGSFSYYMIIGFIAGYIIFYAIFGKVIMKVFDYLLRRSKNAFEKFKLTGVYKRISK